jgi:molecular chaperone GrpE (heat shock protein)
MDSIGKTFDPERHEAVGLAQGGEGMVHAEVRPGYLLDGDVLRPAEVLVGKSEGR